MTEYRLTYQTAVQPSPVSRVFDDKEQLDAHLELVRKKVEEDRIYFKIEPKLEVMH